MNKIYAIKNTILLTLFFLTFLHFSSFSQTAATDSFPHSPKYKYGIISYESKDGVIETIFGGENNKEFKVSKGDHNIKILEILTELGKHGWQIKSTDAYEKMVFGGVYASTVIIYVCKEIKE